MPELPEVETVVRELRPLLVGRRLTAVQMSPHPLRRQWRPEWTEALTDQKVLALGRRGKWILIALGNGSSLVMHLGMTGQLLVEPAKKAVASHTHIRINLDRGRSQLRFRDTRRFGCAILLQDTEELAQFFESLGLGPEPFDLKAGSWYEHLAKTSRCLKAVLLDQRAVAGVGNIYADESLFEARIHPAQLGRETTKRQAHNLRRAIGQVLMRAIERRGSSIRDYVGGSGRRGQYQEEFRVYGRTGKPCPRCGTPVQGIRLAGRSTHFCPRCQR